MFIHRMLLTGYIACIGQTEMEELGDRPYTTDSAPKACQRMALAPAKLQYDSHLKHRVQLLITS